jgi:hypothetical protein
MIRTRPQARRTQPVDDRGRSSWLARAFVVAWLVVMWPVGGSAEEGNSAQQEVFAAERAFAKSMADRDFEAFGRHVADDAIFFGGKDVQRGKSEVLAAWSGFFQGEQAPFSWEPDASRCSPRVNSH